ncbi:NADP-dependent malic enzyme 4 [Arachis hypogaea]|nr:NADP-dependent malic enzyme 4 [Arachis hypogaea]
MILTTDELAYAAYIFGPDLKFQVNRDEVLVSTRTTYANRESLATLIPGEQVIQDVIDSLTCILTQEHKKLNKLPSVWFLPTTFSLLFPKPIVYPSLNPSSRQKLCSLAAAANGCVADALACCLPVAHYLRGEENDPARSSISSSIAEERNEWLFYKLLIEHVEELLPVVYAPTVGEACQKYGSIFMHPQGLYISLKEKGRILEVLRNWPEKNIQFIVVTDGEWILGLGDLGCQRMGIPVGKLSLCTALGGVCLSTCFPITIDVGTNNENLLNDELYIGLKQRRATRQEYAELMHEFMSVVKQNYGEKVLIQGTASLVLAGLVAALKLVGGNLADHRFLFLGAGEVGWTRIAERIALETSKQTNAPLDEVRKNIWLVDSKGLIVSSRKESLQHFKKPWAHDHEPVHRLVDAVNKIKPTVLIGTSGQGRTFTKEVIEAMASINEKPIILSLSNPSSQSECTAEEAYKWSQGRAIFTSGSPFPPVEYEGKVFVPGQANNAYIFPEQSRDSLPPNRAEIPHRQCTTNAKTQINTAPRHHRLTQQGSTTDSTHEATINTTPCHLHSAAFLGSGHPRSTQQVATSTSVYC